jgi:hypothetical protein
MNGIDGERANLEALVGPASRAGRHHRAGVLFQLAFDVGQRELGRVDRHVEFGKNPGQCADVVFVAVRQDDAANVLAILDEITDVGDDDVDAEEFGFGEHQSGVDDDNVVGPANGHAVHAEFAESAEGDDLQFASGHASRESRERDRPKNNGS